MSSFPIGEPLASEDFGFIFPKGSDLVAPMNAAYRITTRAMRPAQCCPDIQTAPL